MYIASISLILKELMVVNAYCQRIVNTILNYHQSEMYHSPHLSSAAGGNSNIYSFWGESQLLDGCMQTKLYEVLFNRYAGEQVSCPGVFSTSACLNQVLKRLS